MYGILLDKRESSMHLYMLFPLPVSLPLCFFLCMHRVDLDVLFLGIGLGGEFLEVLFMLTTNHVMSAVLFLFFFLVCIILSNWFVLYTFILCQKIKEE